MKTYVIGDVHGCHDALMRLLAEPGIRLGEDRLVMLGDYIDRGRQEHEVLAFLMRLRREYGTERIVLLRGNHEQMLLESMGWGGNHASRFGKEELDFMQSLPVSFQDENWFYVHGGIDPGRKLSDQLEADMLWIREECYLYPGALEKNVVFGHTPTRHIHGKDEPVVWKDRVALDTGCVFGGRLSCLVIDNGVAVTTCSVPSVANRCA